MVTMTCKCGATRKTFQKLTEKDFPEGWETDCCMEARAEEKSEDPKQETPKAIKPTPMPSEGAFREPQPEPKKRRGRKPKES